MTTHSFLHLVAVLLTAGAVCVHGGWQRRGAAGGLTAALLMLVAMIDVAYLHVASPVAWTALLLAVAVALAAVRSTRRRLMAPDATAPQGLCVTTHDPLGLVAMAILLLMMPVESAAAGADGHAGHGMGMGMGMLAAVVLAIAAGHAGGSFVAFVRARSVGRRLPYLMMGGATAFMAVAVFA